jgi:hypothetical protein
MLVHSIIRRIRCWVSWVFAILAEEGRMKTAEIFKGIEIVVNDARSSTEESEALLSSVLDDIDALLNQREIVNVKDKAED